MAQQAARLARPTHLERTDRALLLAAADEIEGGPPDRLLDLLLVAAEAAIMGGDRDGNPNVTATVTREVLLLARWMAADLYLRDVENLLADLSMHRASDELLARTGPSHEPYRVVLRSVRDRLKITRRRMEALVEGRPVPDG